MTTKTQKAAATLGRIKSEAKTSTARENGKRGGRPRGVVDMFAIARLWESGPSRGEGRREWHFFATRPDAVKIIRMAKLHPAGKGRYVVRRDEIDTVDSPRCAQYLKIVSLRRAMGVRGFGIELTRRSYGDERREVISAGQLSHLLIYSDDERTALSAARYRST